MTEPPDNTEAHDALWAPWRMEYFDQLATGGDGCFLCRTRDETENDAENLLLWRGRRTFCLLNRFPYTGGHCLVAPNEHVAELADLDSETMIEIMTTLRDLQAALAQGLRAEGFNVGINLGRCAGAGLPGHLHAHLVPRWTGDTNFLPVLGKARVIPEFLDETRTKILQAARDLALPNPGDREG